MATVKSVKGLRRDLVKLHAMVIFLGLLVLIIIYSFSAMAGSIPVTLLIGLTISAAGVASAAISIYTEAISYLSIGTTLEFVGGAVATIDVLDLKDMISILMVAIVPPLAMVQYQLGATIISVRAYLSAEGSDYPPALVDIRKHIADILVDVARMVLLSFLIAVLTLVMVAIYRDVLSLNSLALMGTLIVIIIGGATSLILLKGGRVRSEETEAMNKVDG